MPLDVSVKRIQKACFPGREPLKNKEFHPRNFGTAMAVQPPSGAARFPAGAQTSGQSHNKWVVLST
jgi:hypothetical protein